MTLTVRYLHQSGFELTLSPANGELLPSGAAGRYLLFDYDGSTPVPAVRAERAHPGAAFVSHRHRDHFSEKLFTLKKAHPALQFILSEDVPGAGIKLAPDETFTLPGLTVRTLRSTDEGVAFLLKTEGLTIYHAGDLNWWHWEGEPEGWNRSMSERYRAEIDTLRGERIDLAFLPVDGRLGVAATWGADYFMEKVGAKFIIPMHFWDDPTAFGALRGKPYAAQVRALVTPEESAEFIF